MGKLLRCKLGFHHWHYKLEGSVDFGFQLWAEGTCFYCQEEETVWGLSSKEWFRFGELWMWDKHNPIVKELFNVE